MGILSGKDLALSSWWISLAAKLAVSGRMDLVADTTTYEKREMRPKTLGMSSLFFYFP